MHSDHELVLAINENKHYDLLAFINEVKEKVPMVLGF